MHALGMGGGETWLMEALRLWAKSDTVRADFLITGGERAIFDDEAARLGAGIHYLKYGRRGVGTFTKRFRHLLRGAPYDAIHDHADYATGWHFLLGAGVLPPIRVTHIHNPWLHIEANYAISPSRRIATATGKHLVERMATHVCGTSAEILNTYGFALGNTTGPAVSVLHCGIDVAKFNAPREADRASVLCEFGWGEATKVILFAGRLDRGLASDDPRNHKNSWLAVNAARAAVVRDPSVRLLMAGAGDDARRELEARVRDWHLQDALRLIGVRNDIPRLMRAANLLLFPSRQEGLGMVAVEAQAAGLPVLASTAVPRECVVLPELYTSLPLSDSIDQWADAMLHRMRAPRPSLEACRRALESSPFAIQHSTRQLETIYSARLS